MVKPATRLMEAVSVTVSEITNIAAQALPTGASKEQTLIDASANIVTTLNTLRFGRNVSPTWVLADVSNNPAANASLVIKKVTAGKVGHVYGFLIASEDPSNNFSLNWVSGSANKQMLIVYPGSGTQVVEVDTALTEGLSADAGTEVIIKNREAAVSGARMQAGILYAEL